MTDRPDIVTELMKEEKLGKLQLKKELSSIEDIEKSELKGEEVNKILSKSVMYESYNEKYQDVTIHWQNIIEEISDGFFILDNNLVVKYFNKAAEKLLGKNREDVLGHNLFDAFPEAKGSIFEEKYKWAVNEKKYVSFETFFGVEPYTDWYEVRVQPFDQGISVFFQIITDRKNIEQELRESEKKYRNMIEISPDGIISVNKMGIVTSCNPAFLELTGYSRSEIVGKNALSLPTIPLKSKVKMAGIAKSIFKGEVQESFNFEWKHKNGSIRMGNAKIGLFKEDGKIQGFQAVLRDITEDLIAQNKIKESEERYQALFDGSIDLVYINDFKGNFIDANKACFDLLGYTKDELKNLNFSTFLDKGQLLKAIKNSREIKKYGTQKKPAEFRLKRKDGSFVDVETNGTLIYHDGKPIAIQGIARNITERKKNEEEMAKLVSIIRHSSELVNLADLDGKMVFINEAGSKMLGINPEKVEDFNIIDVIPEKFKNVVQDEVLPSLLKGNIWEGDLQYQNVKNGAIIDVHALTFVIYEPESKKPRYLANVSLDIAIRKKAEKLLRESEEKYRSIFENVDDVIIKVDRFGKILESNKKIEDILGYSLQSIIGKNFMKTKALRFRDAPKIIKMFKDSAKKGIVYDTTDTGMNITEMSLRHNKGHLVDIQVSSTPVIEEGKCVGYLCVLRDVSKINESQKQLRIAHGELNELNKNLEKMVDERTQQIQLLLQQKDEFINQLGHDLKNPIGPLIQLLPILENQEKDSHKKEMINVMLRNTGYMKNLVVKTIELAKLNSPNTKFHFQEMNLSNLVDKVIDTNKLLFQDKEIKVVNNLSDSILLNADHLHMEELLNNIFNNAVKYTDENGKIIIDSENHDNRVTVSVKDTGIGMTEKQLNHIFDEFYKADSSRHDFDSSGLGMPICKRIVEKHGGEIWAESEGKGKGSTFYFTLPFKKIEK